MSATVSTPTDSAVLPVRKITSADLDWALREGWSDFQAKRGDLVFVALLYPAIGLIAAIGTASAQQQGYPPIDDRYSAQPEGAYSDYARVTRVDPVLRSGYGSTETSSGRCYSDDDAYTDRRYDDRYEGRYGNSDRNRYSGRGYDDRTEGRRYEDRRYEDRYANTQGSKVGGGSARYATAAVGSMVGGIAGREIYETTQRNRQPKPRITVCDPVREGSYSNAGNDVTAYDVTYEYAGREYVTRTAYHPGDRIRVRVDVRPEASGR